MSSPRRAKKPTPVEAAFARVLRQLRDERKLTQEQFAERIKSGPTYVSQVERGERSISLKWLFKLADALEVDPASVVRRVDKARQRPRPR